MRFHWFGLLPLHMHSSLSAYATVSYQLLMKEYSTIWLHAEVLTFGSIEICQHIKVNTSNTEFKLFPPNGLSSHVSYLLEHPHYLFVLWSLESWRVCPFLHFSHPCLPLGIRRLHLACRLLPIRSLVLWFSGHRPGLAFLSPTESPYFNPSRPPLLFLSTFVLICTSSHRWPSPGRGCEAKSEWHRM